MMMVTIEILTALSPIILTAVATYIIVKQYNLDKKKFKMESFDKRYKIYKSIMKYLNQLSSNANTTPSEIARFREKTSDTRIFFGEEIQDFVDEIQKKAIRLRRCSQELNKELPSQDDRKDFAREEEEILTWLMNQFSTCEDLFYKYLKIED